jgi:hypothetical protein
MMRSQTSLTSTPGPTSSAIPTFLPTSPTASSAPSPQPKHRLAQPVGTIVGETLAGFFGLILLIFISLFIITRYRRRRHKRISASMTSPSALPTPAAATTSAGVTGRPSPSSARRSRSAYSPEVMDVEMENMSTGPRAI